MADSSAGDSQPSNLMDRKVWTFCIRGGEPFRLGLTDKIGPVLDHDGSMTIWKMVGTAEEAESVESMVTTLIGARVERHTEVEDAEMLAIRDQRLGKEPVPSES